MPVLNAVASAQPLRRLPAIPSATLATLVFVVTEIMYFCALISSYMVIKSHVFGTWAPPGDVRLPLAASALNTLVLMASGVMMVLAVRAYGKPEARNRTKVLLSQSIVLGAAFVIVQGYEWVKLMRYGMTMSSSIFGATFFMVIGSHGLHALAAVLAMVLVYRRLLRGRLSLDAMRAMAVFWLFVVGIWPVLYGLVYFG
jgi:heme/copper-type cytochrome/quinol oxidase subunit 3